MNETVEKLVYEMKEKMEETCLTCPNKKVMCSLTCPLGPIYGVVKREIEKGVYLAKNANSCLS